MAVPSLKPNPCKAHTFAKQDWSASLCNSRARQTSGTTFFSDWFCPADYNRFDATNVDKYVVGDDYTPIWEIPSLNHFYNEQKLGMRAILDAYLQSKGIDSSTIWKHIEKTIAEVFQRRQDNMIAAQKSNPVVARFFELSRFDFVVDENLKVYIMEANMSPNLSSSHFRRNQVLYEQVLMSVLSLVGLANPIEKPAEVYLRSNLKVWSCLDEDTKEEYGEEFKDYFGEFWNQTYRALSSPNINLVIDAYYHALTARYPRTRYFCGYDSIFFYIPLSLTPAWFSDLVIRYVGKQEVLPAFAKKEKAI